MALGHQYQSWISYLSVFIVFSTVVSWDQIAKMMIHHALHIFKDTILMIPSTSVAITGIFLLIATTLGSYTGTIGWRLLKLLCCRKRPTLDFSNVPSLPSFDIAKTPPHPYRPWKAGKYHMTMGIRKMPEEDWLVLDNLYEQEQKLRRYLLENNRNGVMQYLPGSEEACEETLECVVKFLTKRYPSQFQHPNGDLNYIQNLITNRTFKVTAPFEQHPLEITAQLTMEDINLLIQGDGETEYYLRASYSMAPAGWYIEERIGWPLWRIHGPVPLWDQKLRKAMEKFFAGLSVSRPVQRNNYFMQVDDTMFQQEPFPNSLPSPPKIQDIRIRHERQTLRRLPRSKAVLFMVRTFLTPVVELAGEKGNLFAFREAVRAWPPEMAKYKARDVWGAVFEEWCKEILEDHIPEEDMHGM